MMPQPIVHQFTARKFDENAATIPKKKNSPANAWPCSPIVSRMTYAHPPISAIVAKIPSRQERGVGGLKMTCGGASAGSTGVSSDSGFCMEDDSDDKKSWAFR